MKNGEVAKAFDARDTWAGLTVLWPVEGRDLRVPVELTGLPVFGRYHGFQGFRGFGVCDTKAYQSAPEHPSPAVIATPQMPEETVLPQFEDNADLLSDDLLRSGR